MSSYAQEAEITDGGVVNTSAIGQSAPFEGVAFDHQFTIKAGLVLPGRIGIGLFYEQAHFSKKQIFYQNNSQPLTGIIAIAEPQHTIGVEVYIKAPVTNRSYLRFGALFGYTMARTPNPTWKSGYVSSQDFSYSTGLDVAYVFPLARQLSGVLNKGIRYSQANYGSAASGAYVSTYSFPVTAGLNYTFKRRRQQPVNPTKA